MTGFELFKNLLVMAASDGQLTEEEVAYLATKANRWNITEAQFGEALRFAVSNEAVVTIPPSAGERRQLLREMVRIMGIDGELAEIEKDLFAVVAATMQITDDELDQIIDDVLKGEK